MRYWMLVRSVAQQGLPPSAFLEAMGKLPLLLHLSAPLYPKEDITDAIATTPQAIKTEHPAFSNA